MVERGPRVGFNKSLPQEPRSNLGPKNNPPDCPQVEIESLPQLRTFIPNGKRIIPKGLSKVKPAAIDNGFGITKGAVEIPQTREPILPRKKVRHGGGRFIGGGTSKEALQRAKKNNRTKKQPHLQGWFCRWNVDYSSLTRI